MHHVIGLDFETKYCEKEGFGIKQQGMVRYIKDPRFDPYLISVSDGSDTWAGQPKNFNWSSLDGATLVSHNRAFDETVYEEMVLRGLAPRVDLQAWHCTANLAVYLCMRRDLARACEFLLGVTVDKSERGKADGKGWAELTAEDGGVAMLEYARKDALLCWTLWARFGHLWPERERRLSDLTILQGRRGVQIDVENLNRQLILAQSARIHAETLLPWVSEGKPKTSPKAIAEQCRREGIPCPPVKSHIGGEEAFEEWETAYRPKFSWVKAIGDWRQVNKYIGQLETIKSRLYEDGCFPFDLLYFGAHTGRWSGAGGFNLQNLRKEPLGTEGGSLDIRSLFVARPGRKMMAPDLSQIEPRVLAYLAGDTAMLNSMAAGESPYSAHAIATMGWKGGNLKSENKELYALAKARVLGLGYGCGWKKFITVAQVMAGLNITENDPEFVHAVSDEGNFCFDAEGKPLMVSGYGQNSRRIVADYRASNPLVVALWKKLDDAFRASVGGNFEMELPSGRTLRYPEVRRERRAVADPDNPKKFSHRLVYTALTFDQTRNAVVRKPLYGGLLCENLVQATARDVFGEHLLTLDQTPGVNILFHVHDEAVIETDPEISVEQVLKVMSRTPEWLSGCPLAAEGAEILCYQK